MTQEKLLEPDESQSWSNLLLKVIKRAGFFFEELSISLKRKKNLLLTLKNIKLEKENRISVFVGHFRRKLTKRI